MTILLHPVEINRDNNLYAIMRQVFSHVDRVKFSLFCARDCFKLIGDEKTKAIVNNCLKLGEQWLKEERNVSNKRLINACYSTLDVSQVTHSYAAASSSSVTACIVSDDSYYNAAYAAEAASKAFVGESDKKRTQYLNYAYSLLRKSSLQLTVGKISNKNSLEALMNKVKEELIICKDNKFILNHPSSIIANSMPELVDIVWNDASLMHYIECLYVR